MLKVQRIIGEIRSRCLNLFYIIVKGIVGKGLKTSNFSASISLL